MPPEPFLKVLFIGGSGCLGHAAGMKTLLLLAFLAGVVVTPTLRADDDHNRARSAVMAGDILPLKQILERVGAERPGQVLEVELERSRDAWVYEIQLLQPDGRRVKLEVDARNGQILRERMRDREHR